MYIGFDGPPSSMRMVRISIDVTKASRKRPRVTEIDASSRVAMMSGPGSKADTKPDAAIEARSWEMMVWIVRSQSILPVMKRAAVA